MADDDQAAVTILESSPSLPPEEETEEPFPHSFTCCICWDLLYKPVVLGCGHVYCFWCLHESMDNARESHCPVCRHSYCHFPFICWTLDFVLLKMYPTAYGRRERQIQEEEKKRDCFSPQICDACGIHAIHECDLLRNLARSPTPDSESNSCLEPCELRKGETRAIVKQMKPILFMQDDVFVQECKVTNTLLGEGENLSFPQHKPSGSAQLVAVSDVHCFACKQLLFHPVVLNCGHVYCETCIMLPVHGLLNCQVCGSLHPRSCLKVCLVFDKFLEEQFHEEYANRRIAVQVQLQAKVEASTGASKDGHSCSSIPTEEDSNRPVSNLLSHYSVGCDNCGMLPIVGDRYKCKDCVETIGFDLCGDCYNSRCKVRGRFNQKHTPEHTFELIPPALTQTPGMLMMLQPVQWYAFPVYGSDEDEIETESSS